MNALRNDVYSANTLYLYPLQTHCHRSNFQDIKSRLKNSYLKYASSGVETFEFYLIPLPKLKRKRTDVYSVNTLYLYPLQTHGHRSYFQARQSRLVSKKYLVHLVHLKCPTQLHKLIIDNHFKTNRSSLASFLAELPFFLINNPVLDRSCV